MVAATRLLNINIDRLLSSSASKISASRCEQTTFPVEKYVRVLNKKPLAYIQTDQVFAL